jgi:hypothetical protein
MIGTVQRKPVTMLVASMLGLVALTAVPPRALMSAPTGKRASPELLP